jgi:hypothetical protein
VGAADGSAAAVGEATAVGLGTTVGTGRLVAVDWGGSCVGADRAQADNKKVPMIHTAAIFCFFEDFPFISFSNLCSS